LNIFLVIASFVSAEVVVNYSFKDNSVMNAGYLQTGAEVVKGGIDYGALELDGSDGYTYGYYYSNKSSFYESGLTVMGWFNPDVLKGKGNVINDSWVSGKDFRLSPKTDGSVSFEVYFNSIDKWFSVDLVKDSVFSKFYYIEPHKASPKVWNHWAGVYDSLNSSLSLYSNGTLVAHKVINPVASIVPPISYGNISNSTISNSSSISNSSNLSLINVNNATFVNVYNASVSNSSNLSLTNTYYATIINSSNLTLFNTYNVTIINSSNLTLFNTYNVTIINSSNLTLFNIQNIVIVNANSSTFVVPLKNKFCIGEDCGFSGYDYKNKFFDGYVDEVKIYSNSLSDKEIERVYRGESIFKLREERSRGDDEIQESPSETGSYDFEAEDRGFFGRIADFFKRLFS